ncbi:MAG: hypothetical protein GEU73_08875 [Chloroflexi bacterium]|nr:hypothetical protein [Chloroflexota bacterium]
MAEKLAGAPTLLSRWWEAPLQALRGRGRRDGERGNEAELASLIAGLDAAVDAVERVSQRMRDLGKSEPLANTAAICRWEILVLRSRLLDTPVSTRHQGELAQVLRHLDEVAAAARVLSSGYRYHNFDRICGGGEAFDSRVEALSRLRARLAGVVWGESPRPAVAAARSL